MHRAILNPHPQRLPGPQLLHDLALCAHQPNEHAIDHVDAAGRRTQVTYRQLDEQSSCLAQELRRRFQQLGVSSRQRIIVPVYIPQCPLLYIALLAVLKAGASFCPIALDAPEERIKFVVRDVDAPLFLSTSEHVVAFPSIDHVSSCLVDQHLQSRIRGGVEPYTVLPQTSAYILYTSGSTGTPKGVVLSHLAVTQSLLAHDPLIPPFTRFLQFASPTFDVSQFEIWFTLFRGATLISSDRRRLLNDLPGVLNEMEVDGAEFTPTVAGSLLGSRDQVPALSVLLTIGEMLTRHVIDEFGYTHDTPGLLQGMYGPTEAAIHCTMQQNFEQGAKVGIIGTPLSTVSAFVIANKDDPDDDESGELKILDVGEVGELAVGGHQLADGYLNRPEKTEEAFIATREYGIIYRTGDKARLLENGTLECLGRIATGQVKLRGQRVELGEIEHAAGTAAGCRVAVASVLNQNLVIFCLVDSGVTVAAIKQACQKWLPPYMIPSDFVLLQQLPQLPSGKIDRKILEAQYLEHCRDDKSEQEDGESADEHEQTALETLQSVLGSPLGSKVSRAGIDSLSAIRIASILRAKDFDVSAVEVLEANSVKSLASILRRGITRQETTDAQLVDQNLTGAVLQSLSPEQRTKVEAILPCTMLQASMLAETQNDLKAYFNWIELAFEPGQAMGQISAAFQDIIRQNSILRSGFVESDQASPGFAQVIWNVEDCDIQQVKSLQCESNDSRPLREQLLHCLRIQLSVVDESVHALLRIHHCLYDGWTMDLVVDDLNTVLTGQAQAPPRPQFDSVVQYYHGLSKSSMQEPSRDYWRSVLRGMSPVSLPILTSEQPEKPTLCVHTGSLDLSTDTITSKLPGGCHPQVLLQTALSFLLSAYTGVADVCFGTVTSGRTISVTGIEDIMGPCMATLPVRAHVNSSDSALRLLESIARSNRSFLQHCTLPLSEIKSLAQVSPGETLFDTLFIWQESLQSREKDEKVVSVYDSRDYFEFKLVVEAEPKPNTLDFTVRYADSHMSNAQAGVFLVQLQTIIKNFLDSHDAPLAILAHGNQKEFEMKASEDGAIVLDMELNEPRVALLGAIGEIYQTSPLSGVTPTHVDGFGPCFPTGKHGRALSNGAVVAANMHTTQQQHAQESDLESIAKAISSMPHVGEAWAAHVEHFNGKKVIVAYWVPDNPTNASSEIKALELDLRIKSILSRIFDHLFTKFPLYLVPHALIPVQALPELTDNATLGNHFASLSKEYSQQTSLEAAHDQSRNEWSETELMIAGAIASHVGIPASELNKRTSFFSLGINSITAVSFARQLSTRLQSSIQVSEILRLPSIVQLARFVDEGGLAVKTVDLDQTFDAAFRQEVRDRLAERRLRPSKIRPCTPLQEAMLSAELSSQGSHEVYDNHTLFKIHGDTQILRNALNQMFKRHEILRTCFFSSKDPTYTFAQVTLEDYEPPVQDAVKVDSIATFTSSIIRRGLKAVDTCEPPINVSFVRNHSSSFLLLSMQHALYDGAAMERLLAEVEMIYRKEALPDTPSYDMFLSKALNLNKRVTDSFWDRQLANFVPAPFPSLARTVPDGAAPDRCVHRFELPLPLDQLENMAKQHSTSILSICQAAWTKAMSVFVDEEDICFGNVVSGRSLSLDNVEHLVAPCFNTLPVRINLNKLPSFEKLVQSLHSINNSSLEHQFTPLRRIQSRWSSSGERLFDVLFLMQRPGRTLDKNIWEIESDTGNMGFPVVCEMLPAAQTNQINAQLHYRAPWLDKESAKELCDLLCGFVSSFSGEESSSKSLSLSLGVAARIEHAKLHVQYNGTDLHKLASNLMRGYRTLQQMVVLPISEAGGDRVLAFVKFGKELEGEDQEHELHMLVGEISSRLQHDRSSVTASIVDEFILSPSRLPSYQALIRRHRKSLQSRAGPDDSSSFSSTETSIRTILSNFSSVPEAQITKAKTIYQLGLDSINTIQIAKALRAEGFEVSAEEIIQHPTIQSLGVLLNRKDVKPPEARPAFDFGAFRKQFEDEVYARAHCHAEDVEMILPCTPTQAGIIAQFQHSQGSAYMNSWTFDLPLGIEIAKLQLAWQRVTAKYAMLRTGFVGIDSAEHPFAAIVYKQDSAGAYNVVAVNRDSNVDRLRNATANDVLQALYIPAWRASITETPDGKQMNFSGLHSLYDAEVLSMIFGDLRACYADEQISACKDMRPLVSAMLLGTRDEAGRHKEFWVSALQGASPCRFPNLTPERVSLRQVVTKHLLSDTPGDMIRRACKHLGITLQAALQVAYSELLSAYTGDEGVTFGLVLAARETKDADNIAFPSSVTVPYYQASADNTSQMLQEAMSFNSRVREHQFSPLTDIQRWTGNGKTALFDSLLVYQRSASTDDNAPWRLVDERATVEYTVSLEVQHVSKGKLQYSLVFNSGTVTPEHGELFLRQFDSIVAKTLGLDSYSNREDLISIFPPKDLLIPTDVEYLHEFVERTAKENPKAVALEFNEAVGVKSKRKSWTYAEFDALGNRIANYLLKNGLRPGGLVAICFDKCPEASFSTYGILKAGSGFVAIDHGAPIARKKFVIADSKAGAVLTTSKLAAELRQGLDIPVIAMDKINLEEFESNKPNVEKLIDCDATSYCLYTSGSTGTPKGCLISHYNAVQGLLAFRRIFHGKWNEKSRWLQFASFHFDVSVLEQFWSWMVGITVVSVPRDVLFEDLAGNLNALGITHLDLTPSLARLITPKDVPSLCGGVFITGGEQLRQEVLDAWGSTKVIHNFYGPSECTIGVTVNPGVGQNGKASSIGKQFDNVGSYVLKPHTFEPVLKGAAGELCVTGPLLGKGYLNRDDLTKERFPYVEAFGERIYRTGDLVRVFYDGTIDFMGRIDDQVKLRGQRLELGEITNAVKQSSPELKDSHTLVVKDEEKQTEQIVAFLVHTMDKSVDKNQLEAAVWNGCKTRLPPYMVPSRLIWVEQALPLTPNNKVDAKALRACYDSAKQTRSDETVAEDASGPPLSSKAEHAVADALVKCVKLDKAGLTTSTNLFQAGLDSIAVFNFVRALHESGISSATPQMVMSSTSIANLASKFASNIGPRDSSITSAKQTLTAYQQQRSRVARAQRIPIEHIDLVAPCTPLQEGMISRSLGTQADQPLYLNSFKFILAHDVDVEKLRTAWTNVMGYTAILRARFIQFGDVFVQYVLNKESALLHDVFDKDRVTNALDQPLSIDFDCSKGNKVMRISISHALYDAISFDLLLRKLVEEYHDKSPPYGPSFYEALPYGPLRKPDGARQFWTGHLQASHTRLIADLEGNGSGVIKSVSLQLEALEGFEKLRKSLGVTHQAIVQSVWAAVLQVTLKSTTTIGVIVSGRNVDLDNADQIIGPMFNTVPFYAALQPNDTFSDAAKRCHQHNMAVLPYQHTSLREISKWTGKAQRGQLFDSLFVFQKAAADESVGQSLWKQLDSEAVPDYPLAFEAQQVGPDSLKLHVVSSSSLLDEPKLYDMLRVFEKTLLAGLTDPTKPLSDLLGSGYSTSCASSNQTLAKDCCGAGKTIQHDWTNADETERVVAEQLATVSNISLENISPQTTIFEVGLDSIDAIQISSRLKQVGCIISVSSIMQAMTVNAIAQATSTATQSHSRRVEESGEFDELKKSLFEHVSPLLERHNIKLGPDTVLPVTPLQEAMLAEMRATDYAHYFNYDVLRLDKNVDQRKLREAFIELARDDSMLRTGFFEIIDPAVAASFCQYTLPSAVAAQLFGQEPSPEQDFDKLHASHRADVKAQPLLPPVRATITERPEGKYLVLSIAHALYDGFSLGLLHSDLQQTYHGVKVKRPSFEPSLANILLGAGPDSEAYWRDMLQGARSCLIPSTRSRATPAAHRRELSSQSAVQDIESFCKKQSITVQALGQTAYVLVLAALTSSLDVNFGLVLSGRDSEDAQRILFPTMNTVAMRSILHGSVSDMLSSTQHNLAEITQYQHYPLRKVQAMTRAQAGKLFNSIFIYQKSVPQDGSKSFEPIYESLGGEASLEYPVAVEVEIAQGKLMWRMACNEDYFDEEEASELLERLDGTLRRMMQSTDEPVLHYDGDNISILGLPSFSDSGTKTDEDPTAGGQTTTVANGYAAEAETALVEILSRLSSIPAKDIDPAQTLFHLGLDSISAIKVSALLKKKGLRISVSDMLRAGTIGNIASVAAWGEQTTSSESSIPAREAIEQALSGLAVQSALRSAGVDGDQSEDIFPATSQQTFMLQMWANSKGALFWPTFSWTLRGAKSTEVVEHAWNHLVTTMPILRTVFIATESPETPYLQFILRPSAISITSNRPMACLNARKDGEDVIIDLHIHHALYDAVSLDLLVSALASQVAQEPAATVSSASMASYVAASLPDSIVQQRRQFWKGYFADLCPLSSRSGVTHTPRTAKFTPAFLDQHSTTSLTTAASKAGVAVSSIILATIARALARTRTIPIYRLKASGDAVILGLYLSNRTEGTEDLVAPTLTLLPIMARNPLGDMVDLARQIHSDTQALSSNAAAMTASLHEIASHTGVTVDTFFNFLRLPEFRSHPHEGAIRAESRNERLYGALEQPAESEVPLALLGVDKAVAEAYVPSLDIEAAVRDGKLDIGIFGPAERVSQDTSAELVDRIKSELISVAEG